jgi:hypothetical protein
MCSKTIIRLPENLLKSPEQVSFLEEKKGKGRRKLCLRRIVIASRIKLEL